MNNFFFFSFLRLVPVAKQAVSSSQYKPNSVKYFLSLRQISVGHFSRISFLALMVSIMSTVGQHQLLLFSCQGREEQLREVFPFGNDLGVQISRFNRFFSFIQIHLYIFLLLAYLECYTFASFYI